MKLTSWFNEYITTHTPAEAWNNEAALALRMCIRHAYDEACARYVLQSADAFIQGGKCNPANARALFFALEKTGEDKYREAIQRVMTALDAQIAGELDLSAACDTLPFRMAYEMKLNRMERVGATAAMFRSVHQRLWDGKLQRHSVSLQEEGWFLLALTDAIAVCSDQLYEHWRAMVDIYRVTLRGALPVLSEADAQTQALLLYALLTGVEMGLIDPERYLPTARKGIAALRANGEERAADMLGEGVGVQ